MKYKRRKFVAGECMHVYQRTIGGVNIFYDREDYLVFYTMFSVISKLYDITILELCLMIDHIHILVSSDKLDQVALFIQHLTSQFVLVYNRAVGRKGNLFHKSYGSAPKNGSKKIRSTIIYIGNNPVEKSLCLEASEYRWNFLAYSISDHPFSEPLVIRQASRSLRRAIQEVNGAHGRHMYLSYAQLKRMFSELDNKEKAQLVDYIIKRYSVIRYDILTSSCYDGMENMLVAINSNAGSEYDIKEVSWARSDAEYRKLYKYIHAKDYDSAGDIIREPVETKLALLNEMLKETGVPRFQICKYLHLGGT